MQAAAAAFSVSTGNNNTLNVNNATVLQAYGCKSENLDEPGAYTSILKNNTVNFYSGKSREIIGAWAQQASHISLVTNNIVNIVNAELYYDASLSYIIGGLADDVIVDGEKTKVQGNSVYITNTTCAQQSDSDIHYYIIGGGLVTDNTLDYSQVSDNSVYLNYAYNNGTITPQSDTLDFSNSVVYGALLNIHILMKLD